MSEQHGPLPPENHWVGRDDTPIDLVVIHTMVGWISAADARFHNPDERVSAHYGIRVDGSVWQWVDEKDTAYHAGDWNVNLRSIGIEHEDGGDPGGVRPDVLYGSSALLVRSICLRYGIPIDRVHIKGHRELHATACPDALDIDRIVRLAQQGDEVDQATFDKMANDWISRVYGPALEKELADRFAQNSAADVAAAVKAVGQKLVQ